MKLESSDIISQPVDVVYDLVKNEIEKLVPFLPNIKSIEQVERDEVNKNEVKLLNYWHPKVEVPGLVKKFIKNEDIFSWKDYAHWNDKKKIVEYRLEGFMGKDMYTCKGKNYFIETEDGHTELKVTCDLEIFADKIPGIPRLIAGKAKPMIEDLIKKALTPNLTQLSKGLEGYFKKNKSATKKVTKKATKKKTTKKKS
jgi:hypothetical protein